MEASRPPKTVWPTLVYGDANAAIRFLVDVFGFERVTAAGVELVRELRDEDYGSRGFSVRDPEGNLWSFGTYRGE